MGSDKSERFRLGGVWRVIEGNLFLFEELLGLIEGLERSVSLGV